MNRFSSFVLKEIRHILRDARTLIILLVMPVVLVLLFGFAITTEVKNAEIAILDHSKDEATYAITDKILANKYFRLFRNLQSHQEIMPAFRAGEIDLVVVFEHDFQKKLINRQSPQIQLLGDATNPNNSSQLIGFASGIIQDYQREISGNAKIPMQIVPEVRMLYNPNLEGAYYFVPGVITVILMLISALMTSITIAREKEFGNMEVLLVSPLKPGMIIFGKTLPYILLSLINAVSILILGFLVFDMPVAGNLGLLLVEVIIFITTSLALGILISTVTETQQSALLISLVGLMLPTILLSGFIFPIESMPEILQYVSHIVPAKWFIQIVKDIMLKGVGLAVIWPQTLILLTMAVVLLSLSIYKFKIRLE